MLCIISSTGDYRHAENSPLCFYTTLILVAVTQLYVPVISRSQLIKNIF